MPLFYICIEGIIGAGKSSVGEMLAEKYDYQFVAEPVDEWVKSGWLERFYSDPKRYAFEFQIHTFITRLEVHDAAIRSRKPGVDVIILERSIYTDMSVFVEMLHQSGHIPDYLFKEYCSLWNVFASRWPPHPNLIFYLSVPIDVALQRIEERGRESEAVIDIDYLIALDRQHHTWLRTSGLDYYSIDADRPIGKIVDEIQELIEIRQGVRCEESSQGIMF